MMVNPESRAYGMVRPLVFRATNVDRMWIRIREQVHTNTHTPYDRARSLEITIRAASRNGSSLVQRDDAH